MKYVVVILLLFAIAFAAVAHRDNPRRAAEESLTATGNTARIP